MIDFNSISEIRSKGVYGKLVDGRYVILKSQFNGNLIDLMRHIVAMANTYGGVIVFGVNKNTFSVVGVSGQYDKHKRYLEQTIEEFTIGISSRLSCVTVNNKNIIFLEIDKVQTTAYFSRKRTTPHRQNAYRYIQNEDGEIVFFNNELLYERVYKYMSLDAFLCSCYSKSLRFFEPSKWNDKFEQRFYCANYSPSLGYDPPLLYANCVTREKNSEAAWKVYSNGQGLGMHCVQLELNIVELRKQLRTAGYLFEERKVDYKYEGYILSLHKKNNIHYNKYFRPFTLDTFLKLLSLKREAYSYEHEMRLFMITTNKKRNNRKKASHIDIKIDWRNVISKVRIDKRCSDGEMKSVQQACYTVGINPVIKGYTFIEGNTPIIGLKNIEFERFDIDDMPGNGRITIK